MQAINSLFGMMDIGKGALFTSQKGIDIAGHNIANVNTPGYSRQRAVLETNLPLSAMPGQVGTGVRVSEVVRIHDRFIESQLRAEVSSLGQWEAQKGAMEKLERLIQRHGLDQVLGEFWNAWEDLSNNPSGQAERLVLLARSEQLTRSFQGLHSSATFLQEKEQGLAIEGTVSRINDLAARIAELNHTILQAEASGQQANDHRDTRDAILREMASLADINVLDGSDGMLNVFVGRERALVQGSDAMRLGTERNQDTGLTDIIYLGRGSSWSNITNEIDGGRLKGLRADDIFGNFFERLDALAGTIIKEVNDLHEAGYGLTVDLDPETGLPLPGVSFFTGGAASDMAVASAVKNDVNRIAAASTYEGIPGDNSNAIAIAGLRNALLMNGGTATFDTEYNSLVSQCGAWAQTARFQHEHQLGMVNHLEAIRESVSGVHLDEEMVTLLQFQHSYSAAAQFIRMMDKLIEEVIQLV